MSIYSLAEKLRALHQSSETNINKDECQAVLSELKMELARLQTSADGYSLEMLQLSRECLELAALLSVQFRDKVAFEKYIALLRSYYFDYQLVESEKQYLILGLNLLFLLTKARLGDFHIALELISSHKNVYIKFSLDLERDMTEGRMNKIWQAKESVPHDSYIFFVEMLADAARKDIAKCIEASYNKIDKREAMNLLHFQDFSQFQEFMATDELQWVLLGDQIHFNQRQENVSMSLEPSQLIEQSLAYTHEIERII